MGRHWTRKIVGRDFGASASFTSLTNRLYFVDEYRLVSWYSFSGFRVSG